MRINSWSRNWNKPTRGEALLDLELISAQENIKEVKTGGSLCYGHNSLVYFVILRNISLAKREIRTLNFSRMKFQLCKELLDEKCSWEMFLGSEKQNRAGRTLRVLF